ncbi:diaminopimelate decarboxylase [Chitinimonas lacunae]|uniref:Diaminopimelate decarboxylase n=1 Tax=Chitinimonas lacunae TaxID=1963018 RepID=A0ABV8MUW2_9NEIS
MNLVSDGAGRLLYDGVALAEIAERFDTPCYVYSAEHLRTTFAAFRDAFAGHDTLICYALKANSNLSILRLLAELGAGVDIVSGGELQRALAAGVPAERIVFSGVAKSEAEMRLALEVGIHCFNIESEPELIRLNRVAAAMGRTAAISLRINPDVDAHTHPYISTGLKDNKFGIAHGDALAVYRRAAAMANIQVVGIDCHIGSQLTDTAPFLDALDRLLALVDQLAAEGIVLRHLDLGGGLGIRYADETPPAVADYAQAVLARLAGRSLQLVLEPGRALVGNAGLLLTRVEYIKQGETRRFAIVDAGMNDLMRPALYQAWHEIVPVRHRDTPPQTVDVVGPVCESSDFLGRERELAIEEGDLLAVLSSGAYGMTMSSNYNTRPRAAEVLIDGGQVRVIRRRETVAQLIADEQELLG